MADGEVSLKMSLELAQTLQQLQVLINKEGQHDQSIAKTVSSYRLAAKAQREAFKEFEQQNRDRLAGLTRWGQGLDKITAANQRLAAEEAKRVASVNKAGADYELAAMASKLRMRKDLSAVIEHVAIKQAAYQGAVSRGLETQQRLTAGIAQSAAEMGTLECAAQNVPVAIEQAASHSRRLSSNLLTVVGTLGAAAANLMRETIAGAEAESEGAAGEIKRLKIPDLSLLEMARGKTAQERVEDLQGMRSQADKLAEEHGIPREDARELIRQARGRGYEGEVSEIARFSRLAGGVPELMNLIRAGKTAFPDEKLGATQLANAALTASQLSGPLEMKDLASGMPEAGAFAKQAGSNVVETMAGLSVMTAD